MTFKHLAFLVGLTFFVAVMMAGMIGAYVHVVRGHHFVLDKSEGMQKMDEDFRKSVENDLINLEIRQRKADVLKTISEAMRSPETNVKVRTTVNSNVVNTGAE